MTLREWLRLHSVGLERADAEGPPCVNGMMLDVKPSPQDGFSALCWACVVESIRVLYWGSVVETWCNLVARVVAGGCQCSAGQLHGSCNKPRDLEVVLSAHDNFVKAIGAVAQFDQFKTEIKGGRPVGLRSNKDANHFMVVCGYCETADGQPCSLELVDSSGKIGTRQWEPYDAVLADFDRTIFTKPDPKQRAGIAVATNCANDRFRAVADEMYGGLDLGLARDTGVELTRVLVTTAEQPDIEASVIEAVGKRLRGKGESDLFISRVIPKRRVSLRNLAAVAEGQNLSALAYWELLIFRGDAVMALSKVARIGDQLDVGIAVGSEVVSMVEGLRTVESFCHELRESVLELTLLDIEDKSRRALYLKGTHGEVRRIIPLGATPRGFDTNSLLTVEDYINDIREG